MGGRSDHEQEVTLLVLARKAGVDDRKHDNSEMHTKNNQWDRSGDETVPTGLIRTQSCNGDDKILL